MPTIASFENIDIKMQKEGGAQHKKPHVHAYFGEHSASFDIASGDLIVGISRSGKPAWSRGGSSSAARS